MKLGELHKATFELENKTGTLICSCGWKSTPYYFERTTGPGSDQQLEFVRHLLEETEVVTFIAKLDLKMEQLAREIADEFCGGSETVHEAILAKLISSVGEAAPDPDLLEASKAALALLENLKVDDEGDDFLCPEIDTLRAAIAKVQKGGTK